MSAVSAVNDFVSRSVPVLVGDGASHVLELGEASGAQIVDKVDEYVVGGLAANCGASEHGLLLASCDGKLVLEELVALLSGEALLWASFAGHQSVVVAADTGNLSAPFGCLALGAHFKQVAVADCEEVFSVLVSARLVPLALFNQLTVSHE